MTHPAYIHVIFTHTLAREYTGFPIKKVGTVVGSMEESRRTKKSYAILPISQ